MLIQLLRTQVSDYWPLMEPHIVKSIPPLGSSMGANQILYSLLIGMAQCWLFMDKNQEKTEGFIITTSITEISGTRTLLIYIAILLDKEAKVVWEEEFDTLKKYALDTQCTKIAAFVANEKIIAALEKQGANTKFTYVNMNL
jgi:hypothetical protein